MNWQDVLEHPSLQDLPFKIELNEWGQIVMSPASNKQGFYRVEVALQLDQALPTEKLFMRCSIDTVKGVKVADVAWASNAFIERYGYETPYPRAPEICVEILSPSNTAAEMKEKIMLYLAKGAQEVWMCDLEGRLTFHGNEGELESSNLTPHFSSQI